MKVYLDGVTPETLSKHTCLCRLMPEMQKLGVEMPFSDADVALAVGVHGIENIPEGLPIAYRPVYLHPRNTGESKANNDATVATCRRADLVIWQSEWFRKTVRLLTGVKPKAEVVIHNAVTFPDGPMHSTPTCAFCKSPRDPKVKTVGICGSWGKRESGHNRPRKRLAEMYAVARAYAHKHPDVMFLVAGEYAGRLSSASGVLPTGRIPREMIPCFLRRCDAILNLSYFDNCPNTVVEALSLGIPVVCNDQSGAAEMVGEDGGIVVEMDGPIVGFSKTREAPDFGPLPVYAALDRVLNDWPKFTKPELRIAYAAQRYTEELTAICRTSTN